MRLAKLRAVIGLALCAALCLSPAGWAQDPTGQTGRTVSPVAPTPLPAPAPRQTSTEERAADVLGVSGDVYEALELSYKNSPEFKALIARTLDRTPGVVEHATAWIRGLVEGSQVGRTVAKSLGEVLKSGGDVWDAAVGALKGDFERSTRAVTRLVLGLGLAPLIGTACAAGVAMLAVTGLGAAALGVTCVAVGVLTVDKMADLLGGALYRLGEADLSDCVSIAAGFLQPFCSVVPFLNPWLIDGVRWALRAAGVSPGGSRRPPPLQPQFAGGGPDPFSGSLGQRNPGNTFGGGTLTARVGNIDTRARGGATATTRIASANRDTAGSTAVFMDSLINRNGDVSVGALGEPYMTRLGRRCIEVDMQLCVWHKYPKDPDYPCAPGYVYRYGWCKLFSDRDHRIGAGFP